MTATTQRQRNTASVVVMAAMPANDTNDNDKPMITMQP